MSKTVQNEKKYYEVWPFVTRSQNLAALFGASTERCQSVDATTSVASCCTTSTVHNTTKLGYRVDDYHLVDRIICVYEGIEVCAFVSVLCCPSQRQETIIC